MNTVATLVEADRSGLLQYHGTLPRGRFEVQPRNAPEPWAVEADEARALVADLHKLDAALEAELIADWRVSREMVRLIALGMPDDGEQWWVSWPRRRLAGFLLGWQAAHLQLASGSAADARRAEDTAGPLLPHFENPSLDLQLRLRLRGAAEYRGMTLMELSRRIGKTDKTVRQQLTLGFGTGIPIFAAMAMAKVLEVPLQLHPLMETLRPVQAWDRQLAEARDPLPTEPRAWFGLRKLLQLREAGLLVYLGPDDPQSALHALTIEVACGDQSVHVPHEWLADWAAGYRDRHDAREGGARGGPRGGGGDIADI